MIFCTELYNFFMNFFFVKSEKPTNVITEHMIAERTKMSGHSRLPSVQTLTDKMSRLTNRRAHNPKLLLNELTTGDRNVTFSGKTNNHSTSTTKAASSEGKDWHSDRKAHTKVSLIPHPAGIGHCLAFLSDFRNFPSSSV